MSSAAENEKLRESPSTFPQISSIREALISCSKSIEGGDIQESDSSVFELVKFLDWISDEITSHPDNEDLKNEALQVLTEIDNFLASADQTIIDTLSFALPKAVSEYACISDKCSEIVDRIINLFTTTCSPRDMLSILCEALHSPRKDITAFSFFSPLLCGLSKVFRLIKRRHFEQIKVAVPVIFKVLKNMSLESETEFENSFDKAIDIANSIHEVCLKLEGKVNENLRALLGIYVLQIMALLSVSFRYELASYLNHVTRLALLFPYCGISYLGLIAGSDVDMITSIISAEEEDDYMNCLSDVKLGASLSVIWGKMSEAVSKAANEDLTAVNCELQNSQIKRWQAFGMLKHVLSSTKLPWVFKTQAIDLLLCITNANTSCVSDKQIDYLFDMASIFSALQAVILVTIYGPDATLRKNSFDLLKKVLADIPSSHRFDMLNALITNCEYSSMTALLLDVVRNELQKESSQIRAREEDEGTKTKNCACTTTSVLELVESILRPSEGGPPSLPEQADAILAALNLYSFALLTESKGNNCTGVMLKSSLHKVYNEWLLPLRNFVSGIKAKSGNDCDELAVDAECTLNQIQFTLYWCIELVEDRLK